MVRDSLERGEEKEMEIKDFLEKYCDLVEEARKNDDEYDIDLIVKIRGDTVRLEIEETSERNWPQDSKTPEFSSKLLTMPLRKIKYFIEEGKRMDEFLRKKGSINSFEDFYKLYPKKHNYQPVKERNYYIKGSYKMKYLSISSPSLIVNSLNHKLKDQKEVDKRISSVENWKESWIINGNIWLNTSVKNMSGKSRRDPMLLILGHIGTENNINWIEMDELCSFIEEEIK